MTVNPQTLILPLLLALTISFLAVHLHADCIPEDCNQQGWCNNVTNSCDCDPQFKGPGCEEKDNCKHVGPGGVLTNRNCHHGHCVSKNGTNGDYECVCDHGYNQPDCDIRDACKLGADGKPYGNGTTTGPCHNNVTCVASVVGKTPTFKCSCPPGYLPPRCIYKDPCYIMRGGKHPCTSASRGNCSVVYNGTDVPIKLCTCADGYHNATCEVENPCVFMPKCSEYGLCGWWYSEMICRCDGPQFGGDDCKFFDTCLAPKAPNCKLPGAHNPDAPVGPFNEPYCFPCQNDGVCTHHNNSDPFDFQCACKDHHGKYCEYWNPKAMLLVEAGENETIIHVGSKNKNVTNVEVPAGRKYTFYIIILERGDNSSSKFQLNTGDGAPRIAFTDRNYRPIRELPDKKFLNLTGNMSIYKSRTSYVIPFTWTYPVGNFTFYLNHSSRLENAENKIIYNEFTLQIESKLPPGLNCLPTTKLTDVSHNTTNAVEYWRTNHFAIKAALEYDCLGSEWLEQQLTSQHDKKFHFEWKLYQMTQIFSSKSPYNDWHLEKLVTATTDNKYVEFSPHVLLEGLYWIACTAFVQHNGEDYGHSDLGFFRIVNNPPTIKLLGGNEQTVDGDKDIVLDASKSIDESFPEDTLQLDFTWLCLSSPCEQEDWKGSITTIPKDTFPTGSKIMIYLRVKSHHARNEASTNITLHIKSKTTSSVDCVRNCFGNSPGHDLFFLCNYTVDGEVGSAEHIQWSWEPANELLPEMVQDEPYMTMVTLPRVMDADPRFIICNATPPKIGESIISKYKVPINRPPIGGNCTVTPPVGVYLIDSFSISCTPFISVYTPIIYSFYVDVEGAGALVANLKSEILYGYDTNAEISDAYLPYGNPRANWKLDMIVVATDDRGLSTRVPISAIITRPDEGEIENLFEDLVYKNDSVMRKKIHSGEFQGALQLQLLAMMRINDPWYKSQWSADKTSQLLSIIAHDLQNNLPTTFKDMEQVVNSMHLLEQIEDRLQKEVFQSVSEILMDNTEKLAEDVHDPMENTPTNVKNTVANTTTDSGSRIFDKGSLLGDQAKGNQPELSAANLREVTEFVGEERGDTFAAQNVHDLKYEKDNYEEVAESAETDVKDYCNVAKHALNALEHSADAAAAGLAYNSPFYKETQGASLHAEILSRHVDDVNVTMRTLNDNMTVQVNIPGAMIETAVNSTNNDLELHVIETRRNPHCDDTSANPNTPFVEVVMKEPDSHNQIPLVSVDIPLEIILPFSRQLSQAEVDTGKTTNISVLIYPPEELDEFSISSILIYKMNLPFNAKINMEISDVSSSSMIFKVLPMKDRKPHLRDFCELDPIELSNKTDFTLEFESEEIELHQLGQQAEPYLEYYVGILVFDHMNPLTYQTFSMAFTRPTCLNRNQDKKFWSEKGCFVRDVQQTKRQGSPRSQLERITCVCNHLSLFAGVHFVIPHTVADSDPFTDFTFVDLEENLVVIITVAILLCLYIISFFICRYLDRQDEKKSLGLTIMADLKESSFERYYLITVLTGANLWSGTSSCVCMIMYGSNGKSQIYTLKDRDLTVFRRGATDTFLVPCQKELGSLEKIRLWTDHTGHDPAWYCRKILIRHIATNQEWNFYINRWLTVTGEESTVILEIPATDKEEQKKFYVRFKENLLEQVDNAMLWVSIFRFSPNSHFTRCQRLSSAFAVLSSYLMLDIMAVGTVTEDEDGLFEFGEYTIDVYKIMASIQLVLMALPFGIIIIALFRNIIPRYKPTLIIWKNVVPADAELGNKKLFIPTMHGISKKPTFGRRSKGSRQSEASNSGEGEENGPEHNNLQPWNEPQSNSDKVSMSSSSTFSIPSTDIPQLEGWIADRLYQQDSGLVSDEEFDDDMTEEDRFVFSLNEGAGGNNVNHLANNLARLGRRAMSHAVRQYDPEAFIFKGEYDIPDLEELIDQRILEGKKAKPEKPEKPEIDDESVKPDENVEEEPAEKERKLSPLFKKMGEKKTPWKEVVTKKYLEEIDDSLEREMEAKEFLQDTKNLGTQIALELCLLPRIETSRCGWPWWFIFIAWFVCIVSIIGTSGFTVIFGTHFGYLRSMRWMENFIGSLFMSNLVIQPLNTCAVAFLATLFGKRHKLQEMLQVVIQDSDNSDFLESRRPYNFSIFNSFRTYGPLAGNMIFRLKIEARRRKELRSKLLRLVLCILLLIPLIAFAYAGHNYNFRVTQNVRNMFKLNNLGEEKVHFNNKAMVYEYLEDVLLNSIHPVTGLNGQPITMSDRSFLSDQQTVLIGVGRIRQQRVKPSICEDEDSLQNQCFRHRSYRKSSQDRASYNQEWIRVMPESKRNVPSLDNDGWEFHAPDSAKTSSISFSGYHGKYDGGGYIMNLTTTRRGTGNILKHLKAVKWLDHRTRAVFVEFTLINPSINKFVDVVILIEQGATWAFSLKSWITPIELIPFDEFFEKSDQVAWVSASTVVIVIVLTIKIYLFFSDVFGTRKRGLFCSAGLWLDFAIIVTTFVSVGLSVQRFIAAREVVDMMESREVDEYVGIQRAAYWDDLQKTMFSLTLALVYIKTWKLLMFTDKRFLSFSLTIRLTSRYMVAFFIMTAIMITGFAFSGFFLFGNEMWEFSTLGESMITLVDQILDFSFMEQFTDSQSHPFLGMVFSTAFGLFIVFICINFLVAMLEIGVHEAKEVVQQRRVWLTFAQYFKTVLFRTFPTLDPNYKRKRAAAHIKTLPPEKLYAMKQMTIDYLRQFLRDSGHYKMKEMEEHCNKVLPGSGYRVVRKGYKVEKRMKLMNAHIEQLREIATKYFKERLGHDMKSDEFKQYADFNKAIVRLRIRKMETKVGQLEQKIDEFVNTYTSASNR